MILVSLRKFHHGFHNGIESSIRCNWTGFRPILLFDVWWPQPATKLDQLVQCKYLSCCPSNCCVLCWTNGHCNSFNLLSFCLAWDFTDDIWRHSTSRSSQHHGKIQCKSGSYTVICIYKMLSLNSPKLINFIWSCRAWHFKRFFTSSLRWIVNPCLMEAFLSMSLASWRQMMILPTLSLKPLCWSLLVNLFTCSMTSSDLESTAPDWLLCGGCVAPVLFLPNLLLQEYWIQPCFKCYFFSWFSSTKHNLDLNSPHCPHCASHPTFQEYMLTLKNNFTISSFTLLTASLMAWEGVCCCGL